ncbi:gag-pol polyprotein [Tanacetum coccineum]
MRVIVLWTINDFPARSSLSGWSGQGYKACLICNKYTPFVRVLGAYVSHRRFLKKPHKWRRSLEFNGEIEDGDPPRKFDRLQQYLPDEVAKPIIELCSFFKQICSATLMEDDMLKAQSKALEGEPIRPRWMFPFERFMKKLKGYAQNKAKPEGSIAEGYVAEEALTFSSHYFQDVTMKFNRPDCNVDPPPPTCQFEVFRSLCKSIGLLSVIRFDAQELKKVIYKFPNKDMKEEFPTGLGRSCDEHCTTQNNGICSPSGKDGEMYYGQLQEILEFSYLSFKVMLFRVKWFDTSNEGRKVKHLVLRNNMTQILTKDALPHDLADSDDKDLVNVDDDDGVDVVYSSEEED